MFRHVCLFGVLVFILGFTGNAWGQNFSDVVVFGDSLSDPEYSPATRAAGGQQFTTNPDPVWSEIVAQTFGASGMNSLAGGPNYASPEPVCARNVHALIQCRRSWSRSTSTSPCNRAGKPTRTRSISIWAGVNDVCRHIENDQANAESNTVGRRLLNAAQIRRLQEAGARHIVVPNLPDHQ